LETVYRDYAPKGVKFYYIYKSLAHPELNGYVQPISLQERLVHIQQAQRQLGSRITWVADSMNNDVKHALGNAPNSEFVIDPQGAVVVRRAWSDPQQLRADLEKLVGRSETTTSISDLDLKVEPPPKVAASGIVPRIQTPSGLQAVKVVAESGTQPHYVKLRAEVDPNLRRGSPGNLYLGFHLDPIYRVHWNNLVAPIRFELTLPSGVTATPAKGSGPKVTEAADIDPREFLVKIDSSSRIGDPLKIKVQYFACNDDEGWCKPVTQQYEIQFVRDEDAGRPMRRAAQGGRTAAGQRPVNPNIQRFMRRDPLMRALDANGDGEISADELARAPTALQSLDQNHDGTVSGIELRPGRR